MFHIVVYMYVKVLFSISLHAGTFPVVALMVGNAVTRVSSAAAVCADNSTVIDNATRSSSDPCFLDECVVLAVDIAVTLSFLVGILMVRNKNIAYL